MSEVSKAHLVRIELKLSLQDGASDVVHQICSTHLATAARRTDPEASIGIVGVPDNVCCCIDDAREIREVLDGWCNGSRSDRCEEET